MPQQLRSKDVTFDPNILNIEPSDVEYIFDLAEKRGIDKNSIGTVFVMLAADKPMRPTDLGFIDSGVDEYFIYSESELKQAEKIIPRSVYDEKTKRLIGVNPRLDHIFNSMKKES